MNIIDRSTTTNGVISLIERTLPDSSKVYSIEIFDGQKVCNNIPCIDWDDADRRFELLIEALM